MNMPDLSVDLVGLGIAVVGGIGGYFTLREKSKQHGDKIADLSRKHDEMDKAFDRLREELPVQYVRNTELEKFEDRMTAQFSEVKHEIRGLIQRLFAERRLSERQGKPRDGSGATE